MSRDTSKWVAVIAIFILATCASGLLYPTLPDRVPIHWNIRGEVDGYGGRMSVFLTPVIMLGMIGLFAVLPALSPKPFSVDEFKSTYLTMMVLIMLLFAYLHGIVLYATVHPRVDIGRFLMGGIMLFFAILGNLLGKVRRNFYVGIRTPWTLANDRVWADTHRLGAWCMVSGGLLGTLICLVGLPAWVAFIPLVVCLLVPIVYSYTHYKSLEKQGLL